MFNKEQFKFLGFSYTNWAECSLFRSDMNTLTIFCDKISRSIFDIFLLKWKILSYFYLYF